MDEEESHASSPNPASPPLASAAKSQPFPPTTVESSLDTQTKVPLDTENSDEERQTQEIATPTTNQSPRTSSSDGTRTSFDIVGERSGNPSVDGGDDHFEREGSKSSETVKEKKDLVQKEESDDDSDWE